MIRMGNRKRRRSGKHMLIPEPLLLSRLSKYLESMRHEETIDQNKMVEDLRLQYKEYEKRDKVVFRASVFRAYNHILQPLVNPNSVAQSCSSSGEEEETYEEIEDQEEDVTVEDVPPSKTTNKDKNNGILSYLQNVQKMANASMSKVNSKESSGKSGEGDALPADAVNQSVPILDAIDISSDDDEEEELPTTAKINQSAVMDPSIFPPNYAYKRNTPSKQYLARMAGKNSSTIPRIPPSISIKPVSYSYLPKVPGLSVHANQKRKGSAIFSDMKKRRIEIQAKVPIHSFKDFGGSSHIIESMKRLLVHMKVCPEVYRRIGVTPPRGFLLHGPPGCGKTLLANCIAGELGIPMMRVAGPELIAGVSGESESRVRDMFDEAASLSPCVLFIDEIDAVCGRRESASKDMERRVVAQMLSSLDELNDQNEFDQLLIIGATNRPDSLDPGLRRAGRFDREFALGMPDVEGRRSILTLLTEDLKLSADVDLQKLATLTPGFVGADLKSLISQAAIFAVNRVINVINNPNTNDTKSKEDNKTKDDDKEEKKNDDKAEEKKSEEDEEENVVIIPSEESLDNVVIETGDFQQALEEVQPSAKREGFATVPDVTWDDIGSLDQIREQLNTSIMMPVKYPEEFKKLGVLSPTGVLLCGPPGCGKTLLAKAVANEANINFISVKGPELLNMYLGESERAVRQCFQRARSSQPCVIFFDEIDALCPKRSNTDERTGSRVVNQLLTEMDGVEGGRGGVFLMAATNRPDMLDPAVLRPGRLDKILYVGVPSPEDRVLILKAITKNGKKPELNEDVDLEEIGKSEICDGFTGADLAALIKEASVEALTSHIKNKTELKVSADHIKSACKKIRPSVSQKERIRYEEYKKRYTPWDVGSEEKMEEGE